MANRVLDTNKLIQLWHGHGAATKPVRTPDSARDAARAWLNLSRNDGIVTPVRIEFLCGVRDREELLLADIFLDEFPLLDDGVVLPSDWKEAERLAR